MVDDVAEDEDARTRAVLTQVSALVADREALRKDLLRAKEALASSRARAESERAEERDAVCAALQLAEQRARALCVERDNAVAEKSAIEAEALRHKASAVDGDASASASRRAYDDGYAAGWEAALRLPSREYVRAQLKLEKGASATAPTTPTDEFSEITLRDNGGEDASARKENGKPVALADVSLASRASTVLRESFVAVKHRVTELERALSTGKNAASTRTES
jgi:5-carboxymethyl-2-hydroxymuconate isomerase